MDIVKKANNEKIELYTKKDWKGAFGVSLTSKNQSKTTMTVQLISFQVTSKNFGNQFFNELSKTII